jgi:hypothetical protein
MQTPEKPIHDFEGPDGQRIVRSHRAGCACDECKDYQRSGVMQVLERQLLNGRKTSLSGSMNTQRTSR